MTPAEAIALLDQQICPACGERTLIEIEQDDERAVALESCKSKHVWPYDTFSEDSSTNAFEGEFDPQTIDERLEEYGV